MCTKSIHRQIVSPFRGKHTSHTGSALSEGWNIIFSLLKEQEYAIETLCYFMVSPRTSSLQFRSLDMVVNEDKFDQATKTNRCRAPVFLW